jgi:hypothetical protein
LPFWYSLKEVRTVNARVAAQFQASVRPGGQFAICGSAKDGSRTSDRIPGRVLGWLYDKGFSIDGQKPCHQQGGGVPLGHTPVEPEGTTMVVEAGGGGLLLLMQPVSPRAISKAKSENCICKVPVLFNDADRQAIVHQLCVFVNDLRSRRAFARVNR